MTTVLVPRPPVGCTEQPPSLPECGQVVAWSTTSEPLAPDWMRVTVAEPYEDRNGHKVPRRVEVLAGFRWYSPTDLRKAAELLATAAEWLEAQQGTDDSDQLGLFDEEAAG